PHLMRVDQIMPADPADIRRIAGLGGVPKKTPFRASIEDFYFTNPIARASAVMAECSAIAEGRMPMAAE
ncbi:MAG: hypothetical protein M3R18_07185, partial [Pseudomonadota bacterium]|nr:hypothetical protein [Pseudomonadota bacterium]